MSIKRAIEKVNFLSPRTKIDFLVALSNETGLPIRKLVENHRVQNTINTRLFFDDPLPPRSTGGCFRPEVPTPTPWLQPVSHRNQISLSRLTLKSPYHPDGKPTFYLRLALCIGESPKSKHEVAAILGLEPKQTNVYREDKNLGHYVLKGTRTYYSFSSYYEALSICGVIAYDHKTKKWNKGKNYDSFIKYTDNCLLFNGVKIK